MNLADPDPKLRAWAARTILHELGAQDDAPWVLIGHTLPRGTSELAVHVEGALSGARTIPLSAQEAEHWDGYHVAYLGLLVGLPTWTWPHLPRAEHFWVWEDQAVDLWVRRATPEGSRLYAELVTAPNRRRDGAIRGLELQYDVQLDEPRALGGWRLLVRLTGGRRKGDGSRYHTDAAFLDELDQAIRHVQRTTGHANPDPRLVMRKVNYQKSQFYALVKRATGKRWRDLAAEYEKSGIQWN